MSQEDLSDVACNAARKIAEGATLQSSSFLLHEQEEFILQSFWTG